MSSPIPPVEAFALVWIPCPCCWGQRRIFVDAGGGEGFVPEGCAPCLGIGEVLTSA